MEVKDREVRVMVGGQFLSCCLCEVSVKETSGPCAGDISLSMSM